jgi:hypothetical protein
MSVSNNNANLVAWWNNLSDNFNRYLPIFIYIFGIIGNFLNVLVLGQRPLRSNPSAMFFIVTSIAGLIAIVSGLTTRMMAGYTADLTLTINWICVIRNYVLYTARTVALWMMAFAAIDRWCSSNIDNSLRQKSNLKNAQRSILFVLIFSCLVNVPITFCYEAGLTGALRGCYGSTYACRVITDGIYAVITTILPLITMVIFGLLIIRNVHHTRNRVQNLTMSISNQNNNRSANVTGRQQSKRRDRYLLKMLLGQVALLCLFTCGHAIQKAYTSIAAITTSPTVESAISNFIFTVLTLLNFTASGMPFYIYTLTGGSIFRNALFDLIKASSRKILCH